MRLALALYCTPISVTQLGVIRPVIASKHIGTIEIPRRGVEENLLFLEVVALAESEAQLLLAAAGIDQAARQRRGELIGVVDAVAAGELVLGEDLRQAEVRFGRVEIRQLVLRAKWNVDIVEARLQRLEEIAAPESGLAFERYRAVDAVDRQTPAFRRGDSDPRRNSGCRDNRSWASSRNTTSATAR